MMLELIRNDPEYQDGNYTTQPRSLKLASVFFGIATAGGTLNYQKLAPTNEKADQVVDARLAAPMNADANDFIWAWNSSADYDAAPRLESIEASVLAINSADDERDPPESGLEIAALKRVKNGKLYLIPAVTRHAAISPPGRRGFIRSSCKTCSAPRRSRRCKCAKLAMSALCQKRTFCAAAKLTLFDQLVGTIEQLRRDAYTERFCGL